VRGEGRKGGKGGAWPALEGARERKKNEEEEREEMGKLSDAAFSMLLKGKPARAGRKEESRNSIQDPSASPGRGKRGEGKRGGGGATLLYKNTKVPPSPNNTPPRKTLPPHPPFFSLKGGKGSDRLALGEREGGKLS